MFDKFKLVCIGATGIIFIASYFFVGLHYYRNGYETATKKYDEVLRQESEKNYQKIIETEQDKIDMDNLRDVISIDADKLCHKSNTNSAAMPTKATNQSKLRCYTNSELQQKIKESLDITTECDKLAIKYNSLLEWCKL